MKNEKEVSTKELILKVALDLITKEGFEGVTVRKIANLADVNISLINYYFGSKDKLINAAIQVLVTSLKDSFNILDNQSIPPKERLKKFLIQYLSAHEQYPFILRLLISEEPILFESQLEFVNFIKAIGLRKVYSTIEELTGEHDREKLTIMMSHIIGAAVSPILIEPLYEKVTGSSFPDKEKRIELLLNRYFSCSSKEKGNECGGENNSGTASWT